MLTRTDIEDLKHTFAPPAPAGDLIPPPDDDIPLPTSLADYGLSDEAGPEAEAEIERTNEKTNPASIIKATPFIWRAPDTIPPRDWLYGRHYVRSFITATIAPGGLGKTSLALVEAIAMATGRPLLGYPVRHPLRVWYYGGEDPLDEIERRLAAICSHYDILPDEWRGRLFVNSGRKTPIRIAEMGRQQNVLINESAITTIVEELRDHHIDALIADPLVSTHGIPENDNTHQDAMLKLGWSTIAEKASIAIDLIHHVRKSNGTQSEFTVEDARGASALISAARSARVLNVMTAQQGTEADIPESERRQYFRVDDGKANMAALTGKPRWHRLLSVPLGNATADRPEDFVGVVTPWTMPNAMDGVQVDDLRKVQAKIAEGDWAENLQATNWAGHAIGEALDIDSRSERGKAQVKALLNVWTRAGALKVKAKHNPAKGRDQPMIIVGNEG